MTVPNGRTQLHQKDPMLEDVVKYGMILLAIYALPAMLVAALLSWGIQRTRRPLLFWGSALVVGAVSVFCVYTFGHPQEVATIYTRVILHQLLNFKGWDWSALWNAVRPMWLESLPLAPFVGLMLLMSSTKPIERELRDQVRARGKRVEQAAERARKRTSDRVPEVIHEHIVLGVPIYDPDGHER